ncbi:MAG: hypothetical protein HC793_02760 [Aquincola sp.]|nr:hypothetical protein [Aquincola sp.]
MWRRERLQGPLTITVNGPIIIAGALVGDCVAIEINGQGDMTLTGGVAESWDVADLPAPAGWLAPLGLAFLVLGLAQPGRALVIFDNFPADSPYYTVGDTHAAQRAASFVASHSGLASFDLALFHPHLFLLAIKSQPWRVALPDRPPLFGRNRRGLPAAVAFQIGRSQRAKLFQPASWFHATAAFQPAQ